MLEKDLNKVRRYELKYCITESEAAAIRDYIQPLFSKDRNVPPGAVGYTVNNLYLDSPSLRFYWDVKFKRLTRVKPRMRFYGSELEDSIWLELKYKHNGIIWKKRRRIATEEWPGILEARQIDRTEPLIKTHPDTFEEIVAVFGAEPIMHVRYFREPYVSDIDEYGRVTFDRQLRYRSAGGSYELRADDRDMTYYDDPQTAVSPDSPVILEIKVETIMPFWAVNIIRNFNLVQRGFSKYCYAIDRIGQFPAPQRIASAAFR